MHAHDQSTAQSAGLRLSRTLLQQARTSIASLTGPVAEKLVRDLVGQLKDARVHHKALEKLLVAAYRQLPEPNHLDSIIGFGEVTAAILTAKMVTTGHLPGSQKPATAEPVAPSPTHERTGPNAQAAGHKNPVTTPLRSVVTAACDPLSVAEAAAGNHPVAADPAAAASTDLSPEASPLASAAATAPWIDFAHLKTQLPLQRVLEHLSLRAGLRGRSNQRKGPCPVHAPSGKGRTFSVNLDKNLFQCFDPQCGSKGDVIDLWAALHKLSLRAAALDLIQTFNLHPAPRTEKRHG